MSSKSLDVKGMKTVLSQNMVKNVSPYSYSHVPLESMGSTKQTLVAIDVDVSGSTKTFLPDMEKCIAAVIDACKRSPHTDSLKIKLTEFHSDVNQIHGFKDLADCAKSDYTNSLNRQGGSTALYDSSIAGGSALLDFGKKLSDADYEVNGIHFVFSDGWDTDYQGKNGPGTYKALIEEAVAEEYLESIVTILVGVNVQNSSVSNKLKSFAKDGGFTQYIELEKADEKTLAKLANFAVSYVSSQSNSLGSGLKSQPLTFN